MIVGECEHGQDFETCPLCHPLPPVPTPVPETKRKKSNALNPISLEEALSMLDVRNGRVHTFTSPSGIMVGAHWALEDIKALIEEHGCEKAGTLATAFGHRLVIRKRDPLFLATKRENSESKIDP